MKITRLQLKKLIREEITEFPSTARYKEIVDAFKTELISRYDTGDPSMVGAGFASWLEQVDNAIKWIKDRSDLKSFNSVSRRADEMLMLGHFHPDNMFYGKEVGSTQDRKIGDVIDGVISVGEIYAENLTEDDFGKWLEDHEEWRELTLDEIANIGGDPEDFWVGPKEGASHHDAVLTIDDYWSAQ